MTNERNIESSYEHHEEKVQNMENVAYDAHPEFVLNKVDFVLVEVMIITLGILLSTLLLSLLLLSTIKFILNFDSFNFFLMKLLHVLFKNVFVDYEPKACEI